MPAYRRSLVPAVAAPDTLRPRPGSPIGASAARAAPLALRRRGEPSPLVRLGSGARRPRRPRAEPARREERWRGEAQDAAVGRQVALQPLLPLPSDRRGAQVRAEGPPKPAADPAAPPAPDSDPDAAADDVRRPRAPQPRPRRRRRPPAPPPAAAAAVTQADAALKALRASSLAAGSRFAARARRRWARPIPRP